MQGNSELSHLPDGHALVEERGDGYLRRRLGPIFELDLRRLTALRDWIAATIAVASQQLAAFGVNLSQFWFLAMVVLAGTAIFVSALVYPRLEAPRFLKVEQAMMLLAWGTIAVLVYASDGSNSPYIFFYAQTMFYSAYFFSRRLAFAHIGLGSLCALAPIIYDTQAALHNNFIASIAIALPVWWAMSAVVAIKHGATLAAERTARRLALSDPLTGVANLRALEDFVASLDGRRYAVAMIDLDGVREINANYGYFEGDEMLRRAASALREASRPADQVARIGGDEFLVVMPGIDAGAAERWRARFFERIAIANNSAVSGAKVGAAVGVAASAGDLLTLTDVTAVADQDLYENKQPAPEPQRFIAPHARAERLAARLAADTPPSKRLDLVHIDAPAGTFAALLAAVVTGLVISWTGGSTSVLLSLVLVVGAYFAYFGNLRETVVGVTATLTAFGIAVFAEGSVTPVAQTRFSTVVFGTVVIAYALQSNGRKLAAAEAHAEELALTDALTGLPNRRAFDREFGRVVAEATAHPAESQDSVAGRPGLILVDLENFKDVNRVLGHRGGDELLCDATDALRDAIGESGEVFRVGGDEFAVLMYAHHVQRVEKFSAICFEAIRALDADGQYVAKMVAIGATTGYAYWRPEATASKMLDEAFERMDPFAARERVGAS
ncbi:MAG: GGDEF domain-containing protein [Solirubrobacterales bacterium]